MLIINSNGSNPATLKLLIASNLAKKDVDIQLIDERTSRFPVPYIQLENKERIFVSNAVVCYFVPSSPNIEEDVNEWLEWESTVLTPQLANMSSNYSKNSKYQFQMLSKFLDILNNFLVDRKYLSDDHISAADISIFSTLYCLTIDSSLAKEYFSGRPNVYSWINILKMQFKDSIERADITSAQAAYASLSNGLKFPQTKVHDGENCLNESGSPTLLPRHADAASEEEIKFAEASWNKTAVSVHLDKPSVPVLPKPGQKNILITSALPYVNNVPHLGNIIGCVLSADVYARFCRLCNYNTLFVCGTDEYGTATETKALEEDLTCQAICDKYYKIHSEIYKWFNISFDHFGRTSTPQQTQLCQSMFLQLNQNGFIFTQYVDQLHCEKCDRYLADRFVEGGCPNIGCFYEDARGDQCDGCGKLVNAVELKNPRCKICKSTPKLKSSSQFFLDLPKLEPLLLHWMKMSSLGWSSNAQIIGKTWLKEGLKPRCITRDLKWGVQVPLDGYRDKVFYVWFDAPLGYMSITKNYTEEWEKWWRPEKDTQVTLHQFMAKDNVPFHAVMFPATVLGANRGYITVSHIWATEYLNYEDGKFSKSRGVGVFGNDAQETGISSDVFRFYLLYVRPESQDSSFSWIDLATKNNSELLNNLGNFINRALMFIKNSFKKIIPDMQLAKDDYSFLVLCTRELKNYIASLEKGKLRDGIRHILSISRHGNQYMQANRPWVLLKGSNNERVRAGTIVGVCCNIVHLLATLLQPYMPDTSIKLHRQLNSSENALNPNNPEITCQLPPGHHIGEPSPLFAKIELEKVEQLKKIFAGKQKENTTSGSVLHADINRLQEEITKQADKVRAMKSKGLEKKVWQPEVKILLMLKKNLEVARQTEPSAVKPMLNGASSVM